MLETFRNAWKIEDLRKKILFTVLIIAIYRIGCAIPVPFVDASYLSDIIGQGGSMLGYLDMITGGSFANATIFALSITPYINASIIINLLTIAIPALERLSKEGEPGKKKLAKITRYAAVGLAVFLAIAYYFMLRRSGGLKYSNMSTMSGWLSAAVIVSCFVAGACLIIWLSEQIDKKGIGNGMSLLIFVGIVSRLPQAFATGFAYLQLAMTGGKNIKYFFFIPIILVLAVLVVSFAIVLTEGERRLPVQYAKKVVGRKMYGGQNSYFPIKVNLTGVMPIIFASSIISIPGVLKALFVTNKESWLYGLLSFFDYNSLAYAILYFMLIIGFNYFYVAVQYNPVEIANNLRRNNGAIPGIRQGKPTYEYIAKAISKVTIIGAFFLAVVAILPIGLTAVTGVNIALGGTSVLIVVGVALETVKTLEAHMTMRHHKGFLDM